MMNKSTNQKIKKRKIKFSLEIADATEIYVVGDFNAWKVGAHPMKKDRSGHWEKALMLPGGRFEYKFLVDEQWMVDPNNERTCPNCFGTQNSIVNVVV